MGVGPEAAVGGASLMFGLLEALVARGVAAEPPGVAGADHLFVDVASVEDEDGQRSAVAVLAVRVQVRGVGEQGAQVVAGFPSARLAEFGGVDAVQTDALAFAVEDDRDRVAVVDVYDRGGGENEQG